MAKWSVPGYREIRQLGSGATGRVVLAEHAGSGRRVAIKYLDRRLAAEPGFLERFRREAELLAGVRDPHVVRLLDYVEAREGSAIIMEPVLGPTLQRLLSESGPCTPEGALALLHGSLLGLAAAHGAGVIHRDYKPGNVLIDTNGTSRLADFGVAARAGRDAPGLGTPAYMAPEQWGHGPATPSTDMYAASVVFFECLTGQRPYRAETLSGLRRLHEAAPVPIEALPEPVRPLLTLGMAKDPARRYQDVGSFIAHLERAAVTGYGPDWRERGVRDLATAAGILIAAFPLLAAGSGAGAAGSGGGVAAGSSAVPGSGAGYGGAGAGTGGSGAAAGNGAGYSGAATGAGRGAGHSIKTLTHLGSATLKVKALIAVIAVVATACLATAAVVALAPSASVKPITVAGATKASGVTTGGQPTTGDANGGATTSDQSVSPAGATTAPTTTPPEQGPTAQPATTDPSTADPTSPAPRVTTSATTTPTRVTTTTPPAVTTTPVPQQPVTTTPQSPPVTTTTTPTQPQPPKLTATAHSRYPIDVYNCTLGTAPVTIDGTISSDQPVTVSYYWLHSDGKHSATATTTLAAGKPQNVSDTAWSVQAGASRTGGWEQLIVSDAAGHTAQSSQATYTINCVTITVTVTDVTQYNCAATPAQSTLRVDVTALPNSTLTLEEKTTSADGAVHDRKNISFSLNSSGIGYYLVSINSTTSGTALADVTVIGNGGNAFGSTGSGNVSCT